MVGVLLLERRAVGQHPGPHRDQRKVERRNEGCEAPLPKPKSHLRGGIGEQHAQGGRREHKAEQPLRAEPPAPGAQSFPRGREHPGEVFAKERAPADRKLQDDHDRRKREDEGRLRVERVEGGA